MIQGNRRYTGTPEDGVISRVQIVRVLISALSNDAAKNKTFELVAERGEVTPLFAEIAVQSHPLIANKLTGFIQINCR